MIIVTAASENHERSLYQFIRSVYKHVPYPHVIVYDLGLTNKQRFQDEWGITVVPFPFDQYPPYFRIEEQAGQYAWKPVILQLVAQQFPHENLLWMDAGNLVHDDLSLLDLFITENGVFTAVSSGTVQRWTHPGTLTYMQVETPYLNLPCRNAACVGFNPKTKDLLDEWARLAQVQECIAPEGATRLNHRHDQAVLTILFYRYQQKHRFGACPYLCGPGYSIHNDVD